MAGDDAVAGNQQVRIVHAEVAAAVGDELVGLDERPGIEEEVDALARRQLAGVVLLLEAIFAAAELGPALEILEMLDRIHLARRACGPTAVAPACAFSQSARNFFRPMSVSGWLNSESITAGGQVQMSAPIRAASTMCIGPRVAGDEDLGLEVVVLVDPDDVADQAPCRAWRCRRGGPTNGLMKVAPTFGGDQRLRRREAQRDVDP